MILIDKLRRPGMKKQITLLGIGAIFAGQMLCTAQADQKWGPFGATPRINLSYITTDNLFNTRNREKSTGIVVINPGLRLVAGTPILKYVMDLDISVGFYNRSSDDDYVDSSLSGGITYQPTSRAKFDINAGIEYGHDDRGTGRTEGGTGSAKPDEYNQKTLAGEFSYGVAGAKGNLVLSADYLNKEYTNNRSATRGLDHDEMGLGAVFKWRIMPKTRLLFEIRHREFDYDFTPAGIDSLDSDEQRYFIGAEWQATFKTKGSVRIGRLNKDFDSPARKDVSSGAWEAAVEWKPRSYSTVNLSTGRTTAESTGSGDTTLTDYYRASWTHAWVQRLSTTLSYSYSEDDYPGDATGRKDETNSYKAEAMYKMRHWLDLSAGFEHIEKDSNVSSMDYDRNDLFLNARAQF